MAKLPWFPLYVDAFDTDERVVPMDYEAEGVYLALLRFQWRHGTIPSDWAQVARLLKPHSPEALEQVKSCFVPHRSIACRCFNPKLESIREEVNRKREKLVEAGRQGGVASGLSRRSIGEASVEASLKQGSSIASNSIVLPTKASSSTTTTTALTRIPKAEISVRETAVQEKAVRRATVQQGLDLAADVIFRYWRDSLGKNPKTTLFGDQPGKKRDPRKAKVLAALRENGGDVSELLYAIDGAMKDDWLMGRANNSTRTYNDLETILRDRSQIERLRDTVRNHETMHPYLETP
jgi:hypothetical protein